MKLPVNFAPTKKRPAGSTNRARATRLGLKNVVFLPLETVEVFVLTAFFIEFKAIADGGFVGAAVATAQFTDA